MKKCICYDLQVMKELAYELSSEKGATNKVDKKHTFFAGDKRKAV